MNLTDLVPQWLYFLLLGCLAAGAIEDMVRLRISNLTCAAITVLAIIAMLVTGPTWSLWQNLLVFAAILAVGTLAFSAGIIGGGDVKFLAAVALWVPLKTAALLVAAIFLAGGAIALLAMLFWQFRKSGSSSKARQIPYGLAIALGATISFHGVRGG